MSRPFQTFVLLGLIAVVLSVLSLSPYLTRSEDLVRIRNALVLTESTPNDFLWTPSNMPADYMKEVMPADPYFVSLTDKLGLNEALTDWEIVLVISRHLLSHKEPRGDAIQSDLRTTHEQIVNEGQGYCGDFARVFMAMAIATGIPVRAWAFSFDGFGGNGHVWPEIWNRQLNRWQLVPVYDNVYFKRDDGAAISALDLRQALQKEPRTIEWDRLSATATPSYPIEEKMWDYYTRGTNQWYMIWGNNVFSYDKRSREFGPGTISHAVEQLMAVLRGYYPSIRLLETEENIDPVKAIWRLRLHLIAVLGVLICIFAAIGISGLLAIRRRNRNLVAK